MHAPYDWEKFYEEAIRETNFEKLPDCIAKVEQSIQQILAQSPPPITDSAEFDAIGKTLAALAVLKAQIVRQPSAHPPDETRVSGYLT